MVISPWRILAAISAVSVCIYVSLIQLDGVDFWLLAKIGEIISQQGSIPDTLLFPFTEIAAEKFNAHEWLACLMLNWAIKWVGENGMPFLIATLALIYFSLASWLAYIRSKCNTAFALYGGLFAITTENYRHSLRPELIALSLMAIYWIALERFRAKKSIRAAACVLIPVVIWVNTHGSFILAPIIAAIYAFGMHADDIRRTGTFRVSASRETRSFAVLALCVFMACFINPFGWELIQFVMKFSSDPRLSNAILEWSPTIGFIHVPRYWIMMLVWFLTLMAICWNIKRVSMVDVFVFTAFTILATRAIRFPVYIGLVAAFVIPANLAHLGQTNSQKRLLYKGVVVLSLLGLLLAANFGNLTFRQPYSVGMWRMSSQIDKLLRNPKMKGNVLTTMETGPELIYIAYPRLKPSLDSRIDSYGFDYLSYQSAMLTDKKLRDEFVKRYDVKYVLLPRHIWERVKEINSHNFEDWEPVVIDYSAALLRRPDVPELPSEH